MNQRDMVLYSYLKGKEGGGGGGESIPEISGLFGTSFNDNTPIKLKNGRYLSNLVNGTYKNYYPATPDLTKPVYDMSKPFKIHLRVKSSQLKSGSQALIGSDVHYYYQPSIEFQGEGSESLLWAGWSTNGSTWTDSLTILKSEIPFSANTWYTIDYSWDGLYFKLKCSDGTTTIEKELAVNAFYQANGSAIEFGNVSNSQGLYAQYVTFDLADCYWEENGRIIWGNKLGATIDEAPSKLVLEVYEENDIDSQYPRWSWDSNNYDNNYFEYSDIDHAWIAKKEFDGIVFLAMYTYQQASAASWGTYYTAAVKRADPTRYTDSINAMMLRPTIIGNAAGQQDSDYVIMKIKQGDKLIAGKELGYGWVAAYLYVFEVKDTTEKVTNGNISFTQNRGKTLLSEKFEIV